MGVCQWVLLRSMAIEDDEQLAHAGGKSRFGMLACGTQLQIEGSNGWIAADSRYRRHVQYTPYFGASAPDATTAPQGTTVTVKRGQACQSGDLLCRVNYFCRRIDSRFLLLGAARLPHVDCYPSSARLVRGGGGDGEATEHGDTQRIERGDWAALPGGGQVGASSTP